MAGFLENNLLLRTALDTMPIPVFVVDRDFNLLDANVAGTAFLGAVKEQPLRTLAGEALHCINALAATGGCGASPFCTECVLRSTVRESIARGLPVRRRWTLERSEARGKRIQHLFVTAADIPETAQPLSLVVFEDFTEFAEMRGLVPICAGCKKIRDDRDYWEQVERYLDRNGELSVTQSLCPECLAQRYPGTESSH